MKSMRYCGRLLMLALLTVLCQAAENTFPSAGADTAFIGAWSEAVDQVRGRLVLSRFEDNQGNAGFHVYLELQNITFGYASSSEWKFQYMPGESCRWRLTDVHGQTAPRWQGGVPWTLDYARLCLPVAIPSYSTLRFYVASATFMRLPNSGAQEVLVMMDDDAHSPWLVSSADADKYSLSVALHGFASPHDASSGLWTGELVLPKVALPSGQGKH